jgi:small ligand-binding sensory domain FIST
MHADNQRLIDGAQLAAEQVLADSGAQVAVLLVSCVGRRDVLGDEIDDEIEAVRGVFPVGTPMAGFYSYGEIGPHGDDRLSELHNQSMTIASFSEV